MRRDDQPDLFAEPPPRAVGKRALLPPYTLAELTELDRQLRRFDRIPDDWCAGWWDMCDRAYDTVRQAPKEQRDAFRAVFFAEAERLQEVERAEVRLAEAAAASVKRR